MALTFKLYTDAALTQEQAGNLVAVQNSDGSTGGVTHQLWLGSTGSVGDDAVDRKIQADSDPGIDELQILVVDSAQGSGHEKEEVKLGLDETAAGLATPGAPLDLGVTIQSSVANAISFFIIITDATGTVGTSTELSIDTNVFRETDV
ncbi:MAG: hypothetical protein DRR06_06040 [Gammaproteobacteria bacterium]|nr:MAG: hypothetical protein DRR06_06040 [Gammaproteobacteria bacterium]